MKLDTEKFNCFGLLHGAVQICLPICLSPSPVFTSRVRLISPAPPWDLFTYTENVQFVPQPSVAPDVTPLTFSSVRIGAPVAVDTAVIVNIQSFSESRHSFVIVPNVEGFPACIILTPSVALNLNSLFPISASAKVTGKLNDSFIQFTQA